MPELPEVETLRQELSDAIIKKKITEVCVHNPAVIRGCSAKEFQKNLTGQTIMNVRRRAKVLILELSSGKSLVVHLKMTGQLVYPGSGERSRVTFRFSDHTVLDFNDQRLFGELRVMDDWQTLPFIQGLGPEPSQITAEEFRAMAARKKTKIKPLLMDQTFISGVGNLYAAEALFRAKIHPQRSASSLSAQEAGALSKSLRATLDDAIRHKGSSVDDYVRLSGKPGGYVKYHAVYGREGKPCRMCKTAIKRIVLGGRGTYFCPRCQK